MIDHQASQDIRTLFDWRHATSASDTPLRDTGPAPAGNGDLELALQLLACNSRDREQFVVGRTAASPDGMR